MEKLMALREFCGEIGCFCRKGEPMSAHTSFKIGGPADLFIRPEDGNAAASVIRKAAELGAALTVIGKGSDLLVSDDGIRGAVLSLEEESAHPVLEGDTGIRCPAGASLARLCRFALEQELTGLEFAWGIPGSVGGAVFMNAGAYGGEIKDVLAGVSYLDAAGTPAYRDAEELALRYRHSWFSDREGCLITEAVFRLKKGERAAIQARMDDLMDRRKTKQPLEYPSGGSTFKRPAPDVFAAALIENCGLKGRRVGGAMVSEKHAGFVINYDHATCADVIGLVEDVRAQVLAQTGHMLECEIRLLGER